VWSLVRVESGPPKYKAGVNHTLPTCGGIVKLFILTENEGAP